MFDKEDMLIISPLSYDFLHRGAVFRVFRGFHALRQQVSYLLQDLGVHAFTIEDMGGWSDVTIAKRYNHTQREQTKKAPEQLGALIELLLD